MKIVAVTVTCNRGDLLSKALNSIKEQSRKPEFVYVISNSTNEHFAKEQEICSELGFQLIRNSRTGNYAGALNTAVEEIVKRHGTADDLYFASLDDDDIWLPSYLKEIENQNDRDYDLITAEYLRLSKEENLLMKLPDKLSEKDFLRGNPGIGGSNTFIRLKTLLKAGCFDEALESAVDRDFFVRVLQQKPSTKVLHKHLITANTDKNRERLTTNRDKKKISLKVFYYKYRNLMSDDDINIFFQRAKDYFALERSDIEIELNKTSVHRYGEIEFHNKGNYQFVIGFIAGDELKAENIAAQIVKKNAPVDLMLIIEDIPRGKSLQACIQVLSQNNIPFRIIRDSEWKDNLNSGHYGAYFQQFHNINSIPLGRTILHHHLYTETTGFKRPIYWIIDNDITFRFVAGIGTKVNAVDIFDVINAHMDTADAVIGGISNDPPVPLLSCIRSQLVDFYHSTLTPNAMHHDPFSIKEKPDYYYDLSDLHSDHLEIPIYQASLKEEDLHKIYSGKGHTRPSLQKELKAINKTITRRGANTLIFNRALLQYYPVINLEVNNKHARRGDLVWALLNQVVSNRVMFEHTFTIEHNRPTTYFDLKKELDKAAYDIIGYAFAKGMLLTIEKIKSETEPNRPKDIFEKLIHENYYKTFLKLYSGFLHHRKSRFLMNYYRIIGLTKLIAERTRAAEMYFSQLSDESNLIEFEKILYDAQKDATLKTFFKDWINAIWTYSRSITMLSEDSEEYKKKLIDELGIKSSLRLLGRGAEGVVFTDEKHVFKCFFNILDNEWSFLKEKATSFGKNSLLEGIKCHENEKFRVVIYPYHEFSPLEYVDIQYIITFLKFCNLNRFVYTNIKPGNFIQTNTGAIKLIDYGKSFEPFTEEKFLNSIKRAYLVWRFPKMINTEFQRLTARINVGEILQELEGWERLKWAVMPRKKEEILDDTIVSIIKGITPRRILDYGSGKCKTARQLRTATKAEIYVYDNNKELLISRCGKFPVYTPHDDIFHNSFDVALLNLVLCEVEDAVVSEILENISKALKTGGSLVVSVCNPDFARVYNTEFQNRKIIPKSIEKAEIVTKTCIYTGRHKTEYHRPTAKYLKMFEANNFRLKNMYDTDGINIDTLEPVSDFKIFSLMKVL